MKNRLDVSAIEPIHAIQEDLSLQAFKIVLEKTGSVLRKNIIEKIQSASYFVRSQLTAFLEKSGHDSLVELEKALELLMSCENLYQIEALHPCCETHLSYTRIFYFG